ncbi:MAG: hypothetical protein AB1758_37095 [Candidatus Eremiobacterota bacterium]
MSRIAAEISRKFQEADRARDQGLSLHREAIRESSLAIRAIHRLEFPLAERHLEQAREILNRATDLLKQHPCVFHGGFLQDAQKEYAEARVTYAVVREQPIPSPEELGVEDAPYLNGLAEAVGELRRHILDLIRRNQLERGEELLGVMDEIYYVLISIDFPDAITRGLRRSTDVARGCLEKTRGDLTNHLGRVHLEQRIESLRDRVAGQAAAPTSAR